MDGVNLFAHKILFHESPLNFSQFRDVISAAQITPRYCAVFSRSGAKLVPSLDGRMIICSNTPWEAKD